jgi:hypothetical protein
MLAEERGPIMFGDLIRGDNVFDEAGNVIGRVVDRQDGVPRLSLNAAPNFILPVPKSALRKTSGYIGHTRVFCDGGNDV